MTAPADLIAEARALAAMEYRRASWSAHALLPLAWAEDVLPIEDRGPFAIIHCSDPAVALRLLWERTLVVELADALDQALQTIDALRGEGYTVEQLQALREQQ